MTIDEAIAHAREVAKRNRILLDSDELVQKSYDAYFDKLKCEKCAEEHEQLAEWLEDYKRIKMLVPIEQPSKNEYNKAIDDCLLLINENRAKFTADICYWDLHDSIVQLKAGGGNES